MGKICFIVGHGKSKTGGYDSGAVSGNYHEFKIAKEIAKYAQEAYNRKYNEQCDLMNYNGDLYLTDRIKKVNADKYDFIAEFHLNAGGGTGTECYYYHGSEKSRKYADQISKNISKALGIKQRSNGTDDGGDKIKLNNAGKDYFAIVRDTKPCAVLIETVFIDTASDLNTVKTAAGQKKCGEAIADAVAAVRGVSKKTTNATNTTKKEPTTINKTESAFKPYTVKVKTMILNIRSGPGIKYKIVGTIRDRGVYTIVEQKGTWGKLKSGAGWISLNYTKKQ